MYFKYSKRAFILRFITYIYMHTYRYAGACVINIIIKLNLIYNYLFPHLFVYTNKNNFINIII